MDWEIVWRAFVSLPKIAYFKIRYRGRLCLPWVHSLGKHFSLQIKKGSRVLVGNEMVTREQVSLRADGGTLTIGDKCFFNAGCSVTALNKITIGSGCQIANHVIIVDHDHDYKNGWGAFVSAPVTIGKDVWIGANCVILKGANIGDRAVVAAGSVVRGEIPADSVFYQERNNIVRKVSHD